jgi:hypothetical protein
MGVYDGLCSWECMIDFLYGNLFARYSMFHYWRMAYNFTPKIWGSIRKKIGIDR